MNVLLTYGYHHSGHFTAVKALEDELSSRGHTCETKGLWASVSTTIDKLFTIFRSFAAKGVKNVPNFLIEPALLERLAEEHPSIPDLQGYDALISTHPYSSFVLANAKKHQKSSAVLVDVHTDYTPFPLVTHEAIDYHVGAVFTSSPSKNVISKAVCTGIPVREGFKHDSAPKDSLVLVMGGADGFGKIKEALEFTKFLPQNYRYAVFCGRNDELRRKLETRYEQYTFVPFSEDVSAYCKSAKFIFTKASGLTITEALASQCIPIFTPPILFWEDEAAKRVAAQGAGVYLPDYSQLSADMVRNLMRSNESQEVIRKRMQALSNPDAAKDIIDLIERRPKSRLQLEQGLMLDEMKECELFFANANDMPETSAYLEQRIREWIETYESDNSD